MSNKVYTVSFGKGSVLTGNVGSSTGRARDPWDADRAIEVALQKLSEGADFVRIFDSSAEVVTAQPDHVIVHSPLDDPHRKEHEAIADAIRSHLS